MQTGQNLHFSRERDGGLGGGWILDALHNVALVMWIVYALGGLYFEHLDTQAELAVVCQSLEGLLVLLVRLH